jgi:hypothetical protein
MEARALSSSPRKRAQNCQGVLPCSCPLLGSECCDGNGRIGVLKPWCKVGLPPILTCIFGPIVTDIQEWALSGLFEDPRLPHFSITMDDGRLAWPVAKSNGVTLEVFYQRLSLRWSGQRGGRARSSNAGGGAGLQFRDQQAGYQAQCAMLWWSNVWAEMVCARGRTLGAVLFDANSHDVEYAIGEGAL